MPDLQISTNLADKIKSIEGLRKQIPFAVARTLTELAKKGQAATRSRLSDVFVLRNPWTQRGIRIKPAEKKAGDRMAADVHTDTGNRSTGAPDYLGDQETGGERVPINGRHHRAVPTKYLRQLTGNGIIPQELRPKNLLGAVAGRYAHTKRSGQIALKNQKVVRGYVFFLQEIRDGHMAILGRAPSKREAFPFYLLIPEARIRPVLGMEAEVTAVVDAELNPTWDAAWQEMLERGVRL